jgi:hypothetical protein
MEIRNIYSLGLIVVLLLCLTPPVIALTRASAKCPGCWSSRIRFAQAAWAEKLLRAIYLRPYRCQACRKRFYARSRKQIPVSQELTPQKSKRAAGASGS